MRPQYIDSEEDHNIRQLVLIGRKDDKIEWLDWADKRSRKPLGNQRSRRISIRWLKQPSQKEAREQ